MEGAVPSNIILTKTTNYDKLDVYIEQNESSIYGYAIAHHRRLVLDDARRLGRM